VSTVRGDGEAEHDEPELVHPEMVHGVQQTSSGSRLRRTVEVAAGQPERRAAVVIPDDRGPLPLPVSALQ